jgi:predicted DNA-binding transcriptional regulator YafY
MPASKLQRWTDLLAALLSRHYPVTLEQLVAEVPGYNQGQNKSALRRTFERDKDELRKFGVDIRTEPMPDEEDERREGYQLSAQKFYLPYLALMTAAGPTRPSRPKKPGYAALPTLVFEPDELDANTQACARIAELGDPLLAEDAESALRKLAMDLPVQDGAGSDTHLAPARASAAAEVFAVLGSALEDRKRVTFDYHTMGTDTTSRRTVEPFGLFFQNQHWYLAGRTPDEEVIKNYRLSRMTNAEANDKTPNTPDFTIPPDFRLRDHAQSRQAWELGDGDAIDAVVELGNADGATLAAARLGDDVSGHPGRRRFQVRRRDHFVRWLLSFAGDVRPISPPDLVTDYRHMAAETLAVYLPDRPTG